MSNILSIIGMKEIAGKKNSRKNKQNRLISNAHLIYWWQVSYKETEN